MINGENSVADQKIGLAQDEGISVARSSDHFPTDPDSLSVETPFDVRIEALRKYDEVQRRLNEVLAAEAAKFLAELDLPSDQVVLHLHELVAHGAKLWEGDIPKDDEGYRNPDGTPKTIEAGKWRTELVSIGGEVVPPHPDVVPELMAQLTSKIDALLYIAGAPAAESIALWAYTVIMVIHPFDDANGRVGRAFVDYVLQKINIQRGYQTPLHHLDHDHEILNDASYAAIEETQRELKIVPTQFARDQEKIVEKNSMQLYVDAMAAGKPEMYFQAIKAQIQAHIASIDLDKIRSMPTLQDFSRKLYIARNAKKPNTVSLAAEEARQAVQRVFVKS